MKTLLALVFAVLTAGSVFAASSVPAFNAALTMGKESRFVLIGADGKASSWLQVGDSFDGYTIKAYDAKAGTLDLAKDGQITQVRLTADAAVKAGSAGAAAPATLADAENVLNKMHFDQLIEKTIVTQKRIAGAQFDAGMKRAIANGVSPEDAAAFRDKVLNLVSEMLNPEEMRADVSKIYTEVFSKEELDNMAAFYSTPIGQEIAGKQSTIQEKMAPIMQAKMMQMMPKMQQLQQEFTSQQKAKQAAAAAAAAPAPATAPAATGASAPAPAPKP